jgi:hypothetical protein
MAQTIYNEDSAEENIQSMIPYFRKKWIRTERKTNYRINRAVKTGSEKWFILYIKQMHGIQPILKN